MKQTDFVVEVGKDRIEESVLIREETLATACPLCIQHFTAAKKDGKLINIEIKDLSVLLLGS